LTKLEQNQNDILAINVFVEKIITLQHNHTISLPYLQFLETDPRTVSEPIVQEELPSNPPVKF